MRNVKILKIIKSFYLLIFLGVLSIPLSVNKGYAAKYTSNRNSTNQDLSNQDLSNQGGVKSSQYDSIEEIDKKINELEEMKRGYESKALKYNNQAQILQFIEGELQTAKKNWKLAEDNRKIAIRIQKEIDELKIERMKLQKRRG